MGNGGGIATRALALETRRLEGRSIPAEADRRPAQHGIAIPTGLLETRGARTGRPRQNGVIYFHDGERVTIVASKAGAAEHPAWFHNARTNPDVRFGGRPFRAEVVDDEAARERLWRLADRVFPPFATYRASAARSGRTIPILQLVARPERSGSTEQA